MFVKLMRQDCEACEPIVLNSGKHVLGRGLPLKCKDKRISRSHCSLELTEEGVMIFTATHVNPCFWFDVSRQAPAIILHQGEERILKEGDVISLLPDSYKYSVSCEKGVSVNNNSEIQSNMVVPTHIGVLENTGNDNLDSTSIIGSDLPKNDTENLDNKPLNDSNAITNEISNVQDENNSHAELKPDEGNTQNIVTTEVNQSGCVAEADENKTADLAPENTSCDDDKIADGLSDAEVTFDGDDSLDEIEKDVPSPSLLDGVTADTLDKVSSNKREGENNSEASSSAKRHRPNSPEDIKPDVAQLQASVNTGPSVSPVNNLPVDVKVKKEEQDDNSDENNKDDAGPGGSADSSTANNAAPRTKCSFGATCYRKNPIHRVEYCHPGDPDWVIPAPCQWGAQCYRLNPQHRAAFSHPGPPAPRPAPPPGGTDNKKKPVRKAVRKRKQSSYSGSESEDEYDMEDPFMADDSSDEYNPSSDAWSSGGSEEESQDVDPESQGTKRLNRRLLREAKKFVGKK